MVLFSCNDDEVVPVPPPQQPTAKFAIATLSGFGGSITDPQKVNSGQSVKITASPSEHYQLKKWTSNCGSFNKDNLTITITTSKNCEIRAEFEKIKYSIYAISSDGGSTSEEHLSREHGQIANFTAVPEQNFQLCAWKIDEHSDCPTIDEPINPELSFIVQGNCQLEAVFVKQPRTVTTAASEEGGSVTPTSIVEHGDSVTITAQPEEN